MWWSGIGELILSFRVAPSIADNRSVPMTKAEECSTNCDPTRIYTGVGRGSLASLVPETLI